MSLLSILSCYLMLTILGTLCFNKNHQLVGTCTRDLACNIVYNLLAGHRYCVTTVYPYQRAGTQFKCQRTRFASDIWVKQYHHWTAAKRDFKTELINVNKFKPWAVMAYFS